MLSVEQLHDWRVFRSVKYDLKVNLMDEIPISCNFHLHEEDWHPYESGKQISGVKRI